MSISGIADDLSRWAEGAQDRFSELFEPSLRLGVTGLARSGKTVFITSLAANLLRRSRMMGLTAQAEGRILAAALSPQPDMEAPRFDFEKHLGDLYAAPPRWPDSTSSVAQLRVSIRYEPTGILANLTGDAALHLDIVDYPGEWLLDLALMPMSYDDWARTALAAAATRAQAADYIEWMRGVDPEADFIEGDAQTGARLFSAYLQACRRAGYSNLTPGRFLLPGEMAGAPALTFAPLPPHSDGAKGSLAATMAERFEAYKRVVVRPFFRDHFARLDRQIVLVDALGAISNGAEAVADMEMALTGILGAFRPGANSWLSAILGKKIDKLLLAVTKADHIHHRYHPSLQALVRDLLSQSVDRAAFKGAEVDAIAIAGVRATIEEEIRRAGETVPVVRGRLPSGEQAQLFPGEPPNSMTQLARSDWGADVFAVEPLAPPVLEPREDEGPPHIRLDQALEFLIGDRLGGR
ncbi:MAG: YcjX family protein [Pseudomonadota bacterium]